MSESVELKADKNAAVGVQPVSNDQESSHSGSGSDTDKNAEEVIIPLNWKIASIVLVSAIGFGSSWSSGITGAMKSTLKKQLHIDNTQFAILTTSEDFMVTLLILFTGMMTDRIGGAGAIFYGNIIYTIGSILVAGAAQVRSFKFMIAGRVILALGDIATKVAQYKIFSSWFSPNNGFASTLAFELSIGKIGAFVGKSSANIIAKKTGDFAWVFWIAVFMNLFTNVMTFAFYVFTKAARKRFPTTSDPATGEKLTEKSKKFEFKKVLELPWTFWAIIAYSLFETTTASVFSTNATELAEQRFNTDAITAGWYTAAIQYSGFFLVPFIGIFIDVLGNRISLMALTGALCFVSMCLLNFAETTKGTAAAFGLYAFAYCFGPTVIIDSIRTSMWHSSVFGSAFSLKLMMNNSMSIIIGIVCGVIQDKDDNSYDRVTIVYLVLAAGSLAWAILLIVLSYRFMDLGQLQWTRIQRRQKGDVWLARKETFQNENGATNRRISLTLFCCLLLLTLGAWIAYFWGCATGNTD